MVLGVTYLPYQLCHCVFFLVAAGNSFGLHRSVFCFLVVAGNSFQCYLLTLPTIPVVTLCQFFGSGGK